MPTTSPLHWPWLPIRGDREEAGVVSQACTSSPHSAPPPSLCAVILAPWCGRMFTTGWSEPRLLTPQHSPAALWVTRRLGRLLPHVSSFPRPCCPHLLGRWPIMVDQQWVCDFFSSCLGTARVGASRENPSCGLPHHPRAPPDFLAAGFKARKELPSHPI